ncbi:autotransporter domain-containing protein, partial [Acinetobacter baumannii]
MNNYRGYPDDPSTPVSLTGGVDYRVTPGITVGAFVNVGTLKSSYSFGDGYFRQEQYGFGLYTALKAGHWWGTVIGAYGNSNYD